MYDVEVTPGKVVVALRGDTIMTLQGGCALLIGLQYLALHGKDAQRADDYIHGVLQGINHVALSGGVPAVVASL